MNRWLGSGPAGPRGPWTALRHPFAFVRQRFRRRPDSEHEMVINRLVISLLIALYLGGSLTARIAVSPALLVAVAIFAAVSIGLFAHILARPGISAARRTIAIFVDLGFLSYGMHAGDEVATLFYPIYLWVILGNGFRFGLPYLFLSMGVAVVGFAALALTTPFWLTHLHVACGLLLALIILPLYAASLIRKLSTALQQAEQANKAKSLFLASVSHELRTPLNAIIGLSDLLADMKLEAEQKDMTRTIGAAGRSLLRLINSILDFSRLEAGQMPRTIVDFDLHAVIGGVRAILAVQAQSKGLRLSTHFTGRTPWQMRGDRHHLEEILTNLAANAVKFTATGHVIIAVDVVEQAEGKARLRFEVIDTGIGIAADAQQRIFESFRQADETIIDRFGGTGLGLAIVKQLVEMQGGVIGVQSAPGVGSTFWFEISFETRQAEATALPESRRLLAISDDPEIGPVLAALGADVCAVMDLAGAKALLLQPTDAPAPAVLIDEGLVGAELTAAVTDLAAVVPPLPLLVLRADGEQHALPDPLRALVTATLERPLTGAALSNALHAVQRGAAAGEDAPTLRPAARSLSILVAEDNRTNQKVIAKILERAGHRVTIADNGELALDALEANAFDIVLMDINMPVMNGLEATKLYRVVALGEKRVPIVALTADATEDIRARCEEAGMDACLTKPIEAARLLETLASLVPADAGIPVTVVADADPAACDHPAGGEAAGPGQLGEEIIDHKTLDALAELGGTEFVDELVTQFVGDAAAVLRDLAAAAQRGDAQSFREQAHALRSAAANIGARRIYEICLGWRQMPRDELERHGATHLQRLKEEFDAIRAALQVHLPDPPPSRAGAPSLTVIRGGRDAALAG